MNTSESTRIVYDRIKKIEPELASKIVGYLLLGDDSEREMLRLAFCPDNVIQAITDKVKSEFGNKPSYTQNAFPIHLQPQSNNTYWHPGPQLQRASELHHQQLYATAFSQEYSLQLRNQMQHLCLDERYQPRFPVVQSAKMQSKICQYFSSGFCKHGSSCRYLHGNPNEGFAEDQLVSPRSIKKLEFELTELLRSRNGLPVSIALLPMLYFDKFGRNLQAEGYLTESQRHGKAGFSLTKLLARMRPHIHIIESRAHGQHSVVLGEDIHKYMEYANEQNDHGSVSIGERQIYLTFPAESVFTEQDVSNYFNGFGSVQDVRIPCQQKRMFGFVTFLFPETVRKILAKGNPHFVCGARVLVKPYKEKSRLAERKTSERKNAANFCLQFVDGDPNIQNNSESRAACMRLASKQFLEQEQALQLERRLSELQLIHNPLAGTHRILYSTAESNPHEAYSQQAEVPVAERYGFLLDVLKDESTSEERANCTSSTYNDQESCSNQGLHLPTSPFTNSKVNSISTITSLTAG